MVLVRGAVWRDMRAPVGVIRVRGKRARSAHVLGAMVNLEKDIGCERERTVGASYGWLQHGCIYS